ncbi:hypothetical protein [Amycolatopsis sp. NPDC004378]
MKPLHSDVSQAEHLQLKIIERNGRTDWVLAAGSGDMLARSQVSFVDHAECERHFRWSMAKMHRSRVVPYADGWWWVLPGEGEGTVATSGAVFSSRYRCLEHLSRFRRLARRMPAALSHRKAHYGSMALISVLPGTAGDE